VTGLDYCFLCSRQLAPDHTHDTAPAGMNWKTRLAIAAGVAWWLVVVGMAAVVLYEVFA
jgi:hypothetical protein